MGTVNREERCSPSRTQKSEAAAPSPPTHPPIIQHGATDVRNNIQFYDMHRTTPSMHINARPCIAMCRTAETELQHPSPDRNSMLEQTDRTYVRVRTPRTLLSCPNHRLDRTTT